ncbi:MAG: HAD family acid phosphatase [Verrucomicrobiia bacterium]
MNFRRIWSAVGGGILLVSCLVAQSEPLNLTEAKSAVREYHDSGRYQSDVQRVAGWANTWLEQRAAMRKTGERLLVIFDVDETVLSNYPQMVAKDFGYVPEDWVKWVDKAAAPAIKPMREVYRVARKLDVDVVFITGRRAPEEETGTITNLELQGMGGYVRIIFRGESDTAETAAERKQLRRIQLEKEGWTIIASLGDQGSDIAGGHAERIFKLPNPFYEVP